jgi:hypothetical protein
MLDWISPSAIGLPSSSGYSIGVIGKYSTAAVITNPSTHLELRLYTIAKNPVVMAGRLGNHEEF